MNGAPLTLTIAVPRSALSQLESVKVTVTLENQGPLVSVPSAYDLSGALSFAFRAGARVVRRASGLTQQEMMVLGRIDATPSIDELEPGAQWSATLDLGQSTYAPPPGRYRLSAELALPSGERVVSNDVELTIAAESVVSASTVRDNPVIDGLALLVERSHPDEPWLLRQYNTSKPLGAWYGESLPVRVRPMVAQRAFFATESFDHFFERWLVWAEGARVVARTYQYGRPGDGVLEAPLPPSVRLLGCADFGKGALEVFAVEHGVLICAALEPGALRERWRTPLPEGAEGDPCVVADATGYRAAVARAGLCTLRVGRQGNVESWEPRFNTDLRRATLSMDPVAGRVLASFWDGESGQHLQMVEAATEDSARVSLLYRERDGSLSVLRELAFDCSDRREFHALANTEEGLFYLRQDDAPILVALPAARRVPIVSARPSVSLAFFDPERGYHFYEFKKGRLLYRDPHEGSTLRLA